MGVGMVARQPTPPKQPLRLRRLDAVPVLALLLWLSVACAPAFGYEPLRDLGPAEGEAPAVKSSESRLKSAPAQSEAKSDGEAFIGGRIEGKIAPPARVKKVFLVERDKGEKRPAKYDEQTGKFSGENLPAGVWAVEIETTWGRIAGVDMRFRPGDPKVFGEAEAMPPPDKSAACEEPKPSDKPAEPRPAAKPEEPKVKPLSDDDRAEITRHVTGVERFMTPRVLILQGDSRRATVLVTLLRDRDFHGRQGDEVIWRLETWHYENKWGTWERTGGRVVFRERLSGAVFRTWTRQFEPTLGGLEIGPQAAAPLQVSYAVSERPDASRSLIAGVESPPSRPPDAKP